MGKFLKRILVLFIVTFSFVNVLLFFLLNSTFVQHSVINYVNQNVLNEYHLKAQIASLSYNLFSGSLNLNEVDLRTSLPNNKKQDQIVFMSINQISLNFNLISSYLKQKPVLKRLLLRGLKLQLKYDINGHIILPEILKFDDNNNENILTSLNKILSFMPVNSNLLNCSFELGDKGTNNYQHIYISDFSLIKSANNVKFNIYLSALAMKFPFFYHLIDVKYMNIQGSFNNKSDILLSLLHLKSNLADTEAKGFFHLSADLPLSNYTFQVKNLSLNAANIFALLNFKSAGSLNLTGVLSSGKKLTDEPNFLGKAQWINLKFEQFDIYKGVANISYKNKTIIYTNGEIDTYKHGKIYASGRYELFNEFNFYNLANIKSFAFAELLEGLGVHHSPVDFNMKSNRVEIFGNIISKNKKNAFELLAKGIIEAKYIRILPFNQHGRSAIPDFSVQLNLLANALGIYFDHSKAFLNNKASSLFVKNGEISLSNPKGVGVNFDLIGQNIDLSVSDYFTKFPAHGKAQLLGNIHVDPGSKNVKFSSHISAIQGELYGIRFKSVSADWGVDGSKIWVENLVAYPFSQKYQSQLQLKSMHLFFDDEVIDINLKALGELNELTPMLKTILPLSIQTLSGKIKKLDFSLTGALFSPDKWSINSSINIENMKILSAQVDRFFVDLKCNMWSCNNSTVLLKNIYDLSSKIQISKQNAGQFKFVLSNHLDYKNNGVAQLSDFPLGIFSSLLGQSIMGKIDSHLSIYGDIKNPEISSDTMFYNLAINTLKIGDGNFNLNKKLNSQLSLVMTAFNQQFVVSGDLGLNTKQFSQISLQLNHFDPSLLLSTETRSNYNLFSQFTGNFQFTGPNILSKFNLDDWKANGRFQQGMFQTGELIFNLDSRNHLSLNKSSFLVEYANLSSSASFIGTQAKVDFKSGEIFVNISSNTDLGKLQRYTEIIKNAKGNIGTSIQISGSLSAPKFAGNINIEANRVEIRNLPPAWENIKAQIIIDKNRVEIQNFSAKKGEGDFSLSGSIDFQDYLKGNSLLPKLNLNVAARKVDLILPIPIFQTADLNMNSDLSISGDSFPLSVAGTVIINRLKLFRNISCDQISSEILSMKHLESTSISPYASFNLNIIANNSISIQSKCLQAHFSTQPVLSISGDSSSPILSGKIFIDKGILQLLHSRFNIIKGEFQFIDYQNNDPNIDIQMQFSISNYMIYWIMQGRLSKARINLSIDPTNLSNGDSVSQADIISIISTGQIPRQSSSGNIISASTGVASFLGMNNFFDQALNNTVSTVTVGLVDNVSIVPTTQNGQLSWRASASRSLSERLNLGVSYEEGNYGKTSSAYTNYNFNNNVSAVGSYDYSALYQQQVTSELFGGLRFQFGSR